MATYTVTKVRMETAGQGSDRHEHIEGVCTSAGYHTRKAVVDSIDAGSIWKSLADGKSATIYKLTYCPHSNCYATPYIRTGPDATTKNNLDNLPRC